MSAGHSHGTAVAGNEKKLWIVLALTGTFLIAEVIGGLLTKSLALLSDAAHMFTDVMALAIAIVAIRLGRRPADAKRTFGYYRFEILAAAFNAVVLFLVAIYILYEAYQRFLAPSEIQSLGMLAIAVAGLFINLIGMGLLNAGSESSLNVKGAYLEVWSDMLASIGVILAALVIQFTGWVKVDAIIAAAIGLWILPRTWVLLKTSLNILLEGVPEGLEIAAIDKALGDVPGVWQVHELHVWALTSGKNSLTAHLVIDQSKASERQVLQDATNMLRDKFRITHTTLQVEQDNCSTRSPPWSSGGSSRGRC